MSTEYSEDAIIGFLVRTEDFLAPLKQKMEAVTHTEPRYSSKTGKRIEDEVVVDKEAGEYFVFNDKAYGEYDLDELVDALGDEVGLHITTHGNMFVAGNELLAIQPMGLKRRNDGGYNLEDVWESRKELAKGEKKLRALGLDPGTMGVFSVLDVY